MRDLVGLCWAAAAPQMLRPNINAGHESFIVGGAVRDLLRGLAPRDFDIISTATLPQVSVLCLTFTLLISAARCATLRA